MVNDRFLKILGFVSMVVFSSFQCDHSPVGYTELEREARDPSFIEIKPTQKDYYQKYIANGKSSNLFFGIKEGYRARALLEFAIPDSAFDLEEITSIKFYFYARMDLTDTLVPFRIYPITESWNAFQATWILANERVKWQNPGGDLDSTFELANSQFEPESTVVEIGITEFEKLLSSEGIVLITEEGMGVLGAGNSKIVIEYEDREEEEVYPVEQDTYLVTAQFSFPEEGLFIGSGVAYRSFFHFPFKQIPSGARITSSELLLTKISGGFSLSDTLDLAIYRVLEEWDGEYTEYFSLYETRKYFAFQDTLITVDITNLTQFSVSNPESNFGILLSLHPEYSEIAWCEIGILPTVKTTYIIPPDPRFGFQEAGRREQGPGTRRAMSSEKLFDR